MVYALTMPIISFIKRGPKPDPVIELPAVVFDDVTKGYVPWSISSKVPCAPSKRIFSPFILASWIMSIESTVNGNI